MIASIALSPIAMVVTDPRKRDNPIVAVNAAFGRLTGYDAKDVLGRNCRILAGEQTEAWGSQLLHDAVRERRPAFAELLNYRKNGTPFQNAVMIAPCFDERGELEFFVGSQMDVSAGGSMAERRHQANQALRALTPRQREVLRLMAAGQRNKQIAANLRINEKTVKMHRATLLSKLNAATSADAVRIAVEGEL